MINKKCYTENLYAGKGLIRTYTGIYFDVVNPTPEMFCIEDIAHALAQIPRFGGHLPYHYSVAAHSIRTYKTGDRELLELLMHDCAETYLGDMLSPIKNLLPQYKLLEDGILRVASQVFGFNYPFSSYIKNIDKKILEYEWEELMIKGRGYECNILEIEQDFLREFNYIKLYNP